MYQISTITCLLKNSTGNFMYLLIISCATRFSLDEKLSSEVKTVLGPERAQF